PFFLFLTWLFQPILASSSHPSSPTRIVAVGPAQVYVVYLRNLFGKDGLWTQPTLFGRGELTRMVQPMHRLRCQSAERVYASLREARQRFKITKQKILSAHTSAA